jgi:hypothetical protein
MVPFPQAVGVHGADDVSHFCVGCVLDFDFHGFPFGGGDAGVMVEGGAEGEAVEEEGEAVEEEGSVAVEVVAAEEVRHGSLVVVVRCSLVGWCQHRRGCRVSFSCFVCVGSDVAGVLFLGVVVC